MSQNPAKNVLWSKIGKGQLGVTFLKEQSVPNTSYQVDFVCPARKLVVEIADKPLNKRSTQDATRQRLIEQQGYRYLRLAEATVLNSLDNTLQIIHANLDAAK